MSRPKREAEDLGPGLRRIVDRRHGTEVEMWHFGAPQEVVTEASCSPPRGDAWPHTAYDEAVSFLKAARLPHAGPLYYDAETLEPLGAAERTGEPVKHPPPSGRRLGWATLEGYMVLRGFGPLSNERLSARLVDLAAIAFDGAAALPAQRGALFEMGVLAERLDWWQELDARNASNRKGRVNTKLWARDLAEEKLDEAPDASAETLWAEIPDLAQIDDDTITEQDVVIYRDGDRLVAVIEDIDGRREEAISRRTWRWYVSKAKAARPSGK